MRPEDSLTFSGSLRRRSAPSSTHPRMQNAPSPSRRRPHRIYPRAGTHAPSPRAVTRRSQPSTTLWKPSYRHPTTTRRTAKSFAPSPPSSTRDGPATRAPYPRRLKHSTAAVGDDARSVAFGGRELTQSPCDSNTPTRLRPDDADSIGGNIAAAAWKSSRASIASSHVMDSRWSTNAPCGLGPAAPPSACAMSWCPKHVASTLTPGWTSTTVRRKTRRLAIHGYVSLQPWWLPVMTRPA